MRCRFAMILALLLIAGCATPGDLVFRQVGDGPPKMGQAPDDGNYGLFIAGQSQELLEFPLKKEDALGFDRAVDGPVQWLYAVAGTSRNRLDLTQTYEWRRMP